MEDYFTQVSQASNAGLYFLALAGALVIPDMCSGMETASGRSSSSLYKAWVDKHLSPHFTVEPDHIPSFSGEDCWGLRCSLVHQGRLTSHAGSYERILFVEPNSSGVTLHNNGINGALNIDVPMFVSIVVHAAKKWLANARVTPNFMANTQKYMRRYPNGLPPYIGGIPVIA